MLKEFKEFISRGNVLDLAIGVVMGTAFSAIVTSLVNDIIMPLVGVIIGGLNFSGLTIEIKDAVVNYGNFIQNIVNFLIIAVSIFMFVKLINKLSRKEEKKKEEKEEKKEDEQITLLKEIRDELKNKKK